MELEEDLLPYMDLTQEEKDRHRRETVCYICHKSHPTRLESEKS